MTTALFLSEGYLHTNLGVAFLSPAQPQLGTMREDFFLSRHEDRLPTFFPLIESPIKAVISQSWRPFLE